MINLIKWLTPYVIGALISRILFSLGLGVISYAGINMLLDSAFSAVQDYITGLPADMISLMGIAKIDIFINLIFSAYSISLMFFVAKRLRIL